MTDLAAFPGKAELTALHAGAAQGDIKAQFALAEVFACVGGAGGDVGLLSEALVFARLAAEQGAGPQEKRVLAILGLIIKACGEDERHSDIRTRTYAEAIHRLAIAADAGIHGEADDLLPKIASECPPEAIRLAKEMSAVFAPSSSKGI